MSQTASRAAAKVQGRGAALCLCAGLFLLYCSNLRTIYTGDTVATRFLPFSLLLDHTLNVDRWVGPYLFPPGSPNNYFVTCAHGHWMSSYPILTPLVVTPLYVIPSLYLARRPGPIPARTAQTISQGMEKLSAALLAALSAGILFLALRKIAAPGAALAIAVVYGAASSTWSIASQALWTHPLAEVSFALLLWALVGLPGKPRAAFWAGLGLAMAVADKPPNAVFALPVVIYFFLYHRDKLAMFLAPPAVLGALVLSYNLHYFGGVFGAYSAAFRTMGYSSVANGFRGSLWRGMAGFLASPSRSIFVFMPWTVFSIWGAVRLWRDTRIPWGRYLIAGAIGLFLVYSKLERWWGGWTFGPRYLTDLLPVLAFFLAPIWPEIRRRRWLRGAFVVAVAAAIWVQVVGAYYFPSGDWNTTPVSVDEHPERVWDWPDTELARTWHAGPAPSHLTERWRGLEHWLERGKASPGPG
ncbi:MAG TPA: hypothetical protein VGS20_04870 [Candidatus Acidoferrales bacterium]|nr:hypothetical protein [Candidatus Acidoferrales bacterium]